MFQKRGSVGTLPDKTAKAHKSLLLLFFTKEGLPTLWVLLLLGGAIPAAAAPCGTAVIPDEIGQDNPAPVTSLNPLLDDTLANLQIDSLLFRPLVWIGPDDRMDTARSLAADIQAFDGNTRMRVRLKPWNWSDGVPVGADDVAYTWEQIRKLGALWAYNGQGGLPDRVVQLRVIDAKTVDFILREPTNPDWFALNGLSNFHPLPRHVWGDQDVDAMWQRQTDVTLARVVDGPFLLDALHLDRYAAFVPNPRYGGPPAHLARLVVDFLEGGNPLAELHAGAIDMAHVPPALWQTEKTRPGFTPFVLPESFGYLGVVYSFKNDAIAFIRDARVRRALTDAADQASMVALVYHGFSHENRMLVPVVPPTWLSPAAREGLLPVRSDKALARQELENAGWHVGPDGVRVQAGKRLEFTVMIPADRPEHLELMQIWQQDLRAVGVSLQIRPVALETIFAAPYQAPENWEAVLEGNSLYGLPDGNGNFDTGGTFDGGYSDPHMDSLIHASVNTPDTAALFAYEDYAAQEQPVTILPQGGFPLLVAKRIGGAEKFFNPQGFWAPEELWARDGICGQIPGDTDR